MCLTTRFPRIKTKKDIEVYKVLEENLRSPWIGYQYSLNSLVKSDLKTSPVCLITGYIPTIYAVNILPSKIIKPVTVGNFTYVENNNLHLQTIEDGLHSYKDISKAISFVSDSKGYIVYKAIIPAGSYIYINYNEIVSDKLIIKEQVYPC